MNRCIQLARMAAGNVAPNPMVGAVLVHQDRIIGEGYHERYGQAHAEVNCLNSVVAQDRHLITDSTLYVSLEPCAHFGKTPPCADLIIRNKIPRVKIGCVDIFQKVQGKGIQRLREAGVDVTTGICEEACRSLNKRFSTFHQFRRPYIILKWAQSANRMIGMAGQRMQISNTYTNTLVHKWRSEEAAILVGRQTAVADDPLLTNRYGAGQNPLRIVLASDAPENLRMYTAAGDTWVFNNQLSENKGSVQFIQVAAEAYLTTVLTELWHRGIQSILVEGGARTHQFFFDAGAWDECRIITNSHMVIPGGISAAKVPEMHLLNEQKMVGDLIQYYANSHNPFIAYP